MEENNIRAILWQSLSLEGLNEFRINQHLNSQKLDIHLSELFLNNVRNILFFCFDGLALSVQETLKNTMLLEIESLTPDIFQEIILIHLDHMAPYEKTLRKIFLEISFYPCLGKNVYSYGQKYIRHLREIILKDYQSQKLLNKNIWFFFFLMVLGKKILGRDLPEHEYLRFLNTQIEKWWRWLI
jgi:hypothetical protein